MLLTEIINFIKSQIKQIKQIKLLNIQIIIYKVKKLIFCLSIFGLLLIFFPIYLCIRIISKYILIRFSFLPSQSIGHLIIDVNLYLCSLKKNSFFKFDFFYLKKPICNFALIKLLNRHLIILPEIFILPFTILNKIKYIRNSKHNVVLNKFQTGLDLRNRDIEDKQINYFNQKDIENGNYFLRNLGLNKDDKFICLLCRDSQYFNKFYNNNYNLDYYSFGDQSTFRNCNIENFKLISEYLVGLGYYVFRMGSEVSRPFSINSKNFFDYSTLGIRTEYLDIFLSAHCDLFLTTGSGLDAIAQVFNRPTVYVSKSMLSAIPHTSKKNLTIFKHFINKKNGKRLTLSEIFNLNLVVADRNFIFEQKNVELIENNPNEIKEAVIEMLELKNNKFIPEKKKDYLSSKFWHLFKNKLHEHDLNNLYANFFTSKIGYNFLLKNQNWLE
jgi:putative glycosyltransferase (TIGR04372 family)